MNDIDILKQSYEKYKDKTGKKAKALAMRISSSEAFEKICIAVLRAEFNARTHK